MLSTSQKYPIVFQRLSYFYRNPSTECTTSVNKYPFDFRVAGNGHFLLFDNVVTAGSISLLMISLDFACFLRCFGPEPKGTTAPGGRT